MRIKDNVEFLLSHVLDLNLEKCRRCHPCTRARELRPQDNLPAIPQHFVWANKRQPISLSLFEPVSSIRSFINAKRVLLLISRDYLHNPSEVRRRKSFSLAHGSPQY